MWYRSSTHLGSLTAHNPCQFDVNYFIQKPYPVIDCQWNYGTVNITVIVK